MVEQFFGSVIWHLPSAVIDAGVLMRRTTMSILLAGLALPGLGLVCTPIGPRPDEDTLTIGAYSVVREAFHRAILPAFAAEWKRRTGRSVRFEESYNGSGAQ